MARLAFSTLLYALGISCVGVAIWAVGAAVNEHISTPASQYKDSLLSWPALIIPIFLGLVLIALGQRLRAGPSSDQSSITR